MAVKCMNIIDNNTALHKAVVELFADTKIEVTSDMEIRDFPPGYEIEMGSILTTGDFNVAVMGSDGIWKWEENSGSKTAFNGELVYDGTILEGYKVSVKVPSGITKIGDNAFKNLTGLENVNITEGVTLIGDYAFYGCIDLKTVKIASTVTGIGDSAFEGCTGLETVYCEPATPPSLGTDVFDGIASGCTIYVPDASYVAYATSWNDMTDYLLPAGGTVEVTTTGNPISMSDAVAHNAIRTIMSYSPKQSGTGDPSPQNIRPIEGWTEANLSGCGKNIVDLQNVSFDKPSWYTGGWTKASINANNGITQQRTFLQGGAGGFLINLKKGIYTFSSDLITGATHRLGAYYSVDGITSITLLSNIAMSISNSRVYTTFTLPVDTTLLLRPTIYDGENPYDIDNIQIELGATATAYEPYTQGANITESLGDTYYGFMVDVERWVLRVTHEIVDLGSLEWVYDSGNSLFATNVSGAYYAGVRYGAPCLCSSYLSAYYKPSTSWAGFYDKTIACGSNYGATRNTVLKDLDYTDPAVLKVALDGVKLVYELATPLELPLTPQTVALLAGNNTLWTEGDSVALSYLAIASQHQEPTSLLGLTSLSRGISDEEEENPDIIEEPIEEEFIENLEENPEEDIINTLLLKKKQQKMMKDN